MDRWLTPKQAAQVIPHSEQVIRRLLREKKIPGKKIQGLWAVDMKELLGGKCGTN